MAKESSSKSKENEMSVKDYEKIGRMMVEIVGTNYSNKLRFFGFSFMRGVVYGLGIFIGGTIIVAIVIWLLTTFNDAPVIGPILDKLLDLINAGNSAKP